MEEVPLVHPAANEEADEEPKRRPGICWRCCILLHDFFAAIGRHVKKKRQGQWPFEDMNKLRREAQRMERELNSVRDRNPIPIRPLKEPDDLRRHYEALDNEHDEEEDPMESCMHECHM